MPSTPFGEHLKREREMRGVSLEEIAAATRISTRFLEAIENERWDQLPGGVFNRGFIRSIARFLGLDEDSLVAEYALGLKDNAETRVAVVLPGERPRSWRTVVAVILAIIVAILAVAGGILAYKHYRAKISTPSHQQSPALGVPSPADASPAPVASAEPAAGDLSAPAAPALTLRMEVGKPADVKVVADGKTVFEGLVRPIDVKQFEARDAFQITSSEASALLLELNGQTVAPLGTPGQPGSITLTRADLKPATGGSH